MKGFNTMIVTVRQAGCMALLMSAALLQGCAKGPEAAGSRLPIYHADVVGASKACEAKAPSLTPNQSSEVAMKVVNDGGWCGVSVQQDGSKPYAAGLLTSRPGHGTVTVHSVGDTTRIDYVPDKGYTGADSFTVKLLPGNPVVRVAVTVAAS